MDAPTPPIETADNIFERSAVEIEALKSYEPKTDAERRRCATELVRLKQVQIDLAKQVISENAAQQIAEVIGHDYARPTGAARMNGNSNGHARPIDQPNWAQVIAETELRCERQIATLKEEKSSGLNDSDITALAKGLVPYLNARLAEAVAPLQARLDELEATQLTDGGTWNAEKMFQPNQLATYRGAIWVCLQPNSNVRPGTGGGAWRLMHKTIGRNRDEH
jgi:hypothetical protein